MYNGGQRKKSGANFDQLLNKEWSVLTRTEQSELQSAFKRTEQRSGGISFYDMINIIRSLGIPISDDRRDRINKEIANKEIRILDFTVLVNQAATLKKEREDTSRGEVAEENEYLDAFVALGGQPNKTGFVNKHALMEIIKREFELTLDIEAMIDGVQGDALDYSTFCSIFEQDKERGEGRLASAASQRSLKSYASGREFAFDQRDYQKLVQQFENEEPGDH